MLAAITFENEFLKFQSLAADVVAQGDSKLGPPILTRKQHTGPYFSC